MVARFAYIHIITGLIFFTITTTTKIIITNILFHTRSLGALRAPTSSWRPFGPLDFVLCALRAFRPCDPHVGLDSVLAFG